MSSQVQNPVNEITHNLGLPGRTEPARLRHRLVHTNENFTVYWRTTLCRCPDFVGSDEALPSSTRVVKCDDVRRTLVSKKFPVQPDYFRRAHQINAELGAFNSQVGQQCLRNPFQQGQIDFPSTLAIGDDNFHTCHGLALPRCSS